MSLHLVKTSARRQGWHLVQRLPAHPDPRYHEVAVDSRVHFRTKRDGTPWLAQLLPMANWDTLPDTWKPETLYAVMQVVSQIPSVQADLARNEARYAAIRAGRR